MSKALGLTLAITSMIVSGCSSPEKVCRSYIENISLNPETLEFYEFRPFSREELRRISGIDNSLSMSMDQDGYNEATSAINETSDTVTNNASATGIDQYIFRVKSENAMGNRITTFYSCSVKEDICFCADPDS